MTRAKQVTPAPAGHRCRLVLEIDGTPYNVRPLKPAGWPLGATRGYVLARPDSRLGRVRHAIVCGPGWTACSCGSSRYRSGPAAIGGECKHMLAARAVGLMP